MSIASHTDTTEAAAVLNKLIPQALLMFNNNDFDAYNAVDDVDEAVVVVEVDVTGDTVAVQITEATIIDPVTGDVFTTSYDKLITKRDCLEMCTAPNVRLLLNTVDVVPGTYKAKLNRCCCMIDWVPDVSEPLNIAVSRPLVVKQTGNTIILTAEPVSNNIETISNSGLMAVNGVRAVNGNIDIAGIGTVALHVAANKAATKQAAFFDIKDLAFNDEVNGRYFPEEF